MDVTSFLVDERILWVRGGIVSFVGYYLCRPHAGASWKWIAVYAVPLALLAAYWAYHSISFMIEFRSQVVQQVGLSYMVQAYVALLMPFASMLLGLLLWRKSAEPDAAPNGGPAASVDNSNTPGGPPSVS